MHATYSATPVTQAFLPAKTFTSAVEALQYAEQAAKTFHVSYSAWRRFPTLRKLASFPAGHTTTEIQS